jgi:hypothetical protein
MEYLITLLIVFFALFFIYKKIKSKEKCAKCDNVGMCISKSCDTEIEIKKIN